MDSRDFANWLRNYGKLPERYTTDVARAVDDEAARLGTLSSYRVRHGRGERVLVDKATQSAIVFYARDIATQLDVAFHAKGSLPQLEPDDILHYARKAQVWAFAVVIRNECARDATTAVAMLGVIRDLLCELADDVEAGKR